MANLRVNVTDNWGRVLTDVERPLETDAADFRTGYYCRNPQQNKETYIRYCQWVQALLREPTIRTSGPVYMLSMGFIPVCAPPTFWDDAFTKQIVAAFQNAKIPIYPRGQFGLSDYAFLARNIAARPDWWVSKLDMAERMHKPTSAITVKEVLDFVGV